MPVSHNRPKAAALALSLLVALALAWAGPAAAIDCKDASIDCWGPAQDQGGREVMCGAVNEPSHYMFWEAVCKPKNADDFCSTVRRCNQTYPTCCKHDCKVYWKGWQGSWRACPGGFRPPY